MSGSISKAVNKAREKFESLVNEEELKVVVAAAVLVSAADGSISEEEKETAFKAISSHESLREFNQKSIRSHIDSDVNLIPHRPFRGRSASAKRPELVRDGSGPRGIDGLPRWRESMKPDRSLIAMTFVLGAVYLAVMAWLYLVWGECRAFGHSWPYCLKVVVW